MTFFRLRWASPPGSTKCSFIGWPFYNSKSSISNGLASPFGWITFRSLSSAFCLPTVVVMAANKNLFSVFAMAPGSRLCSQRRQQELILNKVLTVVLFLLLSARQPNLMEKPQEPIISSSSHAPDLHTSRSYSNSSDLWGLCRASEIKPSRAGLRQIAGQSRAGVKLSCEKSSWTTRLTAHSLSSDEGIMRILEPLPIACGTKLRGISGTLNIIQKFKIGLHTLGTWTRHPSRLLWILSGARYKKLKAPLWMWRWQSFRRKQSHLSQDLSHWSRPYQDCTPESLDRSARLRIRVGRKWSKGRQDGDRRGSQQ